MARQRLECAPLAGALDCASQTNTKKAGASSRTPNASRLSEANPGRLSLLLISNDLRLIFGVTCPLVVVHQTLTKLDDPDGWGWSTPRKGIRVS